MTEYLIVALESVWLLYGTYAVIGNYHYGEGWVSVAVYFSLLQVTPDGQNLYLCATSGTTTADLISAAK